MNKFERGDFVRVIAANKSGCVFSVSDKNISVKFPSGDLVNYNPSELELNPVWD